MNNPAGDVAASAQKVQKLQHLLRLGPNQQASRGLSGWICRRRRFNKRQPAQTFRMTVSRTSHINVWEEYLAHQQARQQQQLPAQLLWKDMPHTQHLPPHLQGPGTWVPLQPCLVTQILVHASSLQALLARLSVAAEQDVTPSSHTLSWAGPSGPWHTVQALPVTSPTGGCCHSCAGSCCATSELPLDPAGHQHHYAGDQQQQEQAVSRCDTSVLLPALCVVMALLPTLCCRGRRGWGPTAEVERRAAACWQRTPCLLACSGRAASTALSATVVPVLRRPLLLVVELALLAGRKAYSAQDDRSCAELSTMWEASRKLQPGSLLVYSSHRSEQSFWQLWDSRKHALLLPDVLLLANGTAILQRTPAQTWQRDRGWSAGLDGQGWDRPAALALVLDVAADLNRIAAAEQQQWQRQATLMRQQRARQRKGASAAILASPASSTATRPTPVTHPLSCMAPLAACTPCPQLWAAGPLPSSPNYTPSQQTAVSRPAPAPGPGPPHPLLVSKPGPLLLGSSSSSSSSPLPGKRKEHDVLLGPGHPMQPMQHDSMGYAYLAQAHQHGPGVGVGVVDKAQGQRTGVKASAGALPEPHKSCLAREDPHQATHLGTPPQRLSTQQPGPGSLARHQVTEKPGRARAQPRDAPLKAPCQRGSCGREALAHVLHVLSLKTDPTALPLVCATSDAQCELHSLATHSIVGTHSGRRTDSTGGVSGSNEPAAAGSVLDGLRRIGML
ncbi:hypothetical protein V8C86DRAFT_3024878 [Haematococcus lacustris]